MKSPLPIHQSENLLTFLKNGSPVLFPTDTLPALGSLPENANLLWKIKKRTLTKPLILMGSSSDQLFEHVLPEARKDAISMSTNWWPGALTIVLPAIGEVLNQLNPHGNSIGLRVPDCTLTRDFLKKSGPLATTSANISGTNPSFCPQEISRIFPELPLLGPVPWPSFSGLGSTVIEWKGSGHWKLIRKGSVIPSEVKN